MTRRSTPPTLLAVTSILLACSVEGERPNVVLILIDTLRADALGAYGAGDAASPNLDELAARGVLFEQVIAPATWTKPSMASIFTARSAARHGVRLEEHALPAELTTLAEAFASAGYRTLGVNSNPWLTDRFAFGAGFERYESTVGIADIVNRTALAWLEEPSQRPTFLFLHYLDVHAPYRPSPAFFDVPPLRGPAQGRLPDAVLEERYRKELLDGPHVRARVRALYAGGVRELDAAIGDMLRALGSRGFLDGAIVAVTSDHGEAFGEHGRPEHGQDVYPELHRVPWIVHAPGLLREGGRVTDVVSGIDVAPTLLSLARVPIPDGFEGRVLLPLGLQRGDERPAITVGGLSRHAPDRDYVGVVWRNHLFVRERATGTAELYDLEADPGAREDLVATGAQSAVLAELAEIARRAEVVSVDPPPRAEIDAETSRQLEALGYLDASPAR